LNYFYENNNFKWLNLVCFEREKHFTWKRLRTAGHGAYIYNPTYLGGGNQEDISLRSGWAKSL
jgi:hypothetical protein